MIPARFYMKNRQFLNFVAHDQYADVLEIKISQAYGTNVQKYSNLSLHYVRNWLLGLWAC